MYSLHNHSTFCDGKKSVEQMISAACSEGLDHFGLSSHAPVLFGNKWSISSDEKAMEYFNEISKWSDNKGKIQIWAGLEADYIPSVTKPFSHWRENFNCEYLIGSIHLVENDGQLWFIDGPAEGYDKGLLDIFGNDMRSAVRAFYHQTCEMIETQQPDILGHCDKVLMHNRGRFIRFDDLFHLKLLKEMLTLAAEKSIIVEINTRGIYRNLHPDYYPGKYIFDFLKEKNIHVMLSADAHDTDQLTREFDNLKRDILAAGIRETWLPTCISDSPIPLT